MSNFLTIQERERILGEKDPKVGAFVKALSLRVAERVGTGGLSTKSDYAPWWYMVAEYLSDAAMLYQVIPIEGLEEWLHDMTMSIAQKPLAEWIGPAFRDHGKPFRGHLETAHICWGLSVVLDLCYPIFTLEEQQDIKTALYKKGIHLCEQWLEQNNHLGNWRGIMSSGALVASVILEDEERIAHFLKETALLSHAFQPDGSYGESLQYGNYLANALMLAYESLIRRHPEQANKLDTSCYAKGMSWVAQSMLYQKPLAGWGDTARARAVNFNDSAALFRPSGDLLLHVAVRYANKDKDIAGLSRWLFDAYYASCPEQGPHDLATFGMRNDWGFLTLPLLTYPAYSKSPETLDLPLTAAFSNGNVLIRDQWDGSTTLAIQAGNNDGLYASGHLQGDLNSFIIAYHQERLLVDPGHSCYRNILHGLESATQAHNTCFFLIEEDGLGLQEDLAKGTLLEQKNVLPRRTLFNGQPSKPLDRGGNLLHCQRLEEVSLVISEVAKSYGHPLKKFTRCWIQIGAHITLILDHIQADEPVKTVWNWVFNNRDGDSAIRTTKDCITLYRHQAALKLFHLGTGILRGPIYAHLHDAYHPEPNQLGEGGSGSAVIYRFTDEVFGLSAQRMHILITEDEVVLDDWTVNTGVNSYILNNKEETWKISLKNQSSLAIDIEHNEKHITIVSQSDKILMKYD